MTTLSRIARPLAYAAMFACLTLTSVAFAQAPSADDSAELQRLLKDKQYAQALKLIDDALAKKPDDPKLRFRKGVVLSYLDRSNDALKVFEKLAQDHPDMPAPYNNMAVLLAGRGEYERARAALEAAIRTNPAYATAYQNLGDVYARLASQAYTKALQLDKADATLAPKLALLRELTTGDPPAAATAVAAAQAPATVADKPAAPAAAKPGATTVAAATPAPVPAATPAPTAPVAAQSPKPAAQPAPAPPSAAPADAGADVSKAVKAWAEAWSRRDMNAYFAAYASGYAPAGKTHKAWQEDRRARIAARSRIKVEVNDLRVTTQGDKATARFRQVYESDTLSTSGMKSLELVKDPAGRWVIRQESVGG